MYIIAITIAVGIVYVIQTKIKNREERKKLYGKEYEINLIDGTYYVTADRRKFEAISQRAIPNYIKNSYAKAGEILTDKDMPFDRRVAILKKMVRLIRKTVGRLLFKCQLKGVVFSYSLKEYEDFDIRQIVRTDEKEDQQI